MPRKQKKLLNNVNRRSFIKTTTALSVAAGVWSELPAAESDSANEKLKVLCVGTANRAAEDVRGVQGEEIIGICDVDSNYLDRAAKTFPDANKYADYREMISQEADKADAIVIATADHNHAPAAIRAIHAGLHCYCEKPLTHTVQEARILTEAARARGLATQLGTQIHAQPNYRRVVEMIQAGTIGDVNEVHVWVGKGWGGGDRPAVGQEPPANLNWDLWLGPAPERPYAAGRYHPAQWRRWWDFGQGTLGDMACHYMDLPFWALDLKYPIACEAEGPEVHPETCPMGLTVRYKFPARGSKPAVDLTWYDGDRTPREVAGERVPGSGVMFIGSEGNLYADYSNYKLFPIDKFVGFVPPEKTIPDSIGHHAEWIKACKDGSPTTCNFDYSGPLTEAVLLGNVAYRTGKSLDWDATQLKATNCPEADMYLAKEYRPGWEVA
ncbi:Gfo/Idh/MocA family protein [Novipirellula artificiosorum]|uniref:Putative oxidoreductase YteT n=1 Tax=Novipirellula artificiosorum TaxID=2528016 RepID=A0A5C6D876_9BACT|nr:Gfo/Idh/MocA family oxidoreductase [Novipirellula artificiosorum]TWU32978.1 putative oxidoreductase YteT precursor [Novipirellula artificiosorum]